MRPAAALIAICCSFLVTACGSGRGPGNAEESTSTTAAPPGSLEALWRASKERVAVVPGTADYVAGRNRVSFLIVDKQSRLVERPIARLWVAHGLKRKPFATTTARLEPVGVPGGDTADAQNIYVAHVRTPVPGTYWILAEPVGGRKIGAVGTMVVKREAAAPSVGDRAIPSRNPTVASGLDPKTITTARPPDTDLLQVSIAHALARKQPFVVTFATPLYCQTRLCGPVVQVVQFVARRFAGHGVAFIHIEIYRDNDPAKKTNAWVNEWKLPSEPFTFVVDRTGVIRTKLEGAFSAKELFAAVKAVTRS